MMQLVYLHLIEWQEEAEYDSWNSYRGDLAHLRDYAALEPGELVFFLVTRNSDGVEFDLGQTSLGPWRPNPNRCP